MGLGTSATGRGSCALGVSTKASSEGELSCGVYTEDSPTTGVVLRVGTGHESRSPLPQDPLHMSTYHTTVHAHEPAENHVLAHMLAHMLDHFCWCAAQVKHDALRVNADGTLYLRRKGGAAIPDVQACVEALQKEFREAHEGHEVTNAELAALRSEMMATARSHQQERAADHEQLAATNAELAATKQDLAETKARLADLEARFRAVLGKLDVFRDVSRM